LHLAENSLNSAIDGGTPVGDGFVFAEADAPELEIGALIGKVGPRADHLHFGVRGTVGAYAQKRSLPIPRAFSDFERFDSDANKWTRVEAGFLQVGDIFRKPS
jgi:hypothetical protein